VHSWQIISNISKREKLNRWSVGWLELFKLLTQGLSMYLPRENGLKQFEMQRFGSIEGIFNLNFKKTKPEIDFSLPIDRIKESHFNFSKVVLYAIRIRNRNES
jgi:hypothetical protein